MPEIKANPAPFDRFLAGPSGHIRWMLSTPTGQRRLREIMQEQPAEPERPAESPLQRQGGDMPAPPDGPTVVSNSRFHDASGVSEPDMRARSQNEQSIGFDTSPFVGVIGTNDTPGAPVTDERPSGTGYGIFTGDLATPTAFTLLRYGGLPRVPDPLGKGFLLGGGDPVVIADPSRHLFYMLDVRFNDNTTAIGLFRSDSTTLTTCGTDQECWPVRTARFARPLEGYFQDKPWGTVDARTKGVGAGNVYVVWTEFDFFDVSSRIFISVCNKNLECQPEVVISGDDIATQFADVSVAPDGQVIITWINVANPSTFRIRYRSCAPAPGTLGLCGPIHTVFNEKQALPFGGFLYNHDFGIITYPKNASRTQGASTRETWVVWDRCRFATVGRDVRICTDADVVASTTTNDGATWSAPISAPVVDGHQFFSTIAADQDQGTIHVCYYDTGADSLEHRIRVVCNHIDNNSVEFNGENRFVSRRFEPCNDPNFGCTFIGDYIEVATSAPSPAQTGGIIYIGFTSTMFSKRVVDFAEPTLQQDPLISKYTH
jgi:hypothetical protein